MPNGWPHLELRVRKEPRRNLANGCLHEVDWPLAARYYSKFHPRAGEFDKTLTPEY